MDFVSACLCGKTFFATKVQRHEEEPVNLITWCFLNLVTKL